MENLSFALSTDLFSLTCFRLLCRGLAEKQKRSHDSLRALHIYGHCHLIRMAQLGDFSAQLLVPQSTGVLRIVGKPGSN